MTLALAKKLLPRKMLSLALGLTLSLQANLQGDSLAGAPAQSCSTLLQGSLTSISYCVWICSSHRHPHLQTQQLPRSSPGERLPASPPPIPQLPKELCPAAQPATPAGSAEQPSRSPMRALTWSWLSLEARIASLVGVTFVLAAEANLEHPAFPLQQKHKVSSKLSPSHFEQQKDSVRQNME